MTPTQLDKKSKTFKSAHNGYIATLLWIIILFLLCIVFVFPDPDGKVLSAAILLPIIVVLAWSLLDTRYIFKESYFAYRSGVFRGRIEYESITRIETDNSFFKSVINKPAFGRKGFMIYYGKFEEIYISPANGAGFVEELKKRVPGLIVTIPS